MKKIIFIFFVIYSFPLWANINDDLINAAENGDQVELEYLLKNGADVNSINKWGMTALIQASSQGHLEIVNILINNNAMLDIEDNLFHYTALGYANINGNKDIAKQLKLAGAGKNDNIVRASANGDLERVKILLTSSKEGINAHDKYGRTALIESVTSGGIELVNLLISNGADPNIANSKTMNTALMRASTTDEKIDIVKLLLSAGAYINAKDSHGTTALMWASTDGAIDVVKLLLEKGANPNFLTDDGSSALNLNSKTTKNQNNYKSIMKLLKKYGAKE